jgi:hypothetical protein
LQKPTKINKYCKDRQRQIHTTKTDKDRQRHINTTNTTQRPTKTTGTLYFNVQNLIFCSFFSITLVKRATSINFLEKELNFTFIYRFRLTEFLLLTDAFPPIMTPKRPTQKQRKIHHVVRALKEVKETQR